MTQATDSADGTSVESSSRDDASADEARNFGVLALYQILLRTGWIFKTESIIMPAVLDTLAGAGWIRGWLPVLNRFGYSVPPLLMARRVKVMPRKKWSVFSTTTYMTLAFAGMAALFRVDKVTYGPWLPTAFLALYGLFFTANGVNQLSLSTLTGKLVATTRRGRLLLVSNTIGAVTAIICAFTLMPSWLDNAAPRFDLLFGFSGLLFAASAAVTLLAVEAPDDFREAPSAAHHYLLDALRLLREDRRFRRLAFVAAMYGTSLMLFPHYQNLGLRGMRLDLKHVMWWVIVQNVGTALFSVPAGSLADRFGNRLVLRWGLACIVVAPLSALVVLIVETQAALAFNIVFFFVGVTPVVLRTFQNYALELSPPEDHPRYLSTMSLVISAPIFLSPVAGWLIDVMGYTTVFLFVAVAVLCGLCGTFGMAEPRQAESAAEWPDPLEVP